MKRIILSALLPVTAFIFLFAFCGCVDQSAPKEAVLSFHSFDGGGAEYSVEVDDPDILAYSSEKKYSKANHKELNGAGYDVIFSFKGLKPGKTSVTVTENMRGEESNYIYVATVSDDLSVSLEKQKK